MKKALITGVSGQDGSYLAELLLSKGYEVHGIIRRSSSINTWRLDSIFEEPYLMSKKFILHYGDLEDASRITNLVQTIKPDEIYHLGAQSHVRVSFDIPSYTGTVTGVATTNLLEAIRQTDTKIKFYQASSSELFGSTPPPQSELTKFHPRSPYAAAKLYAYWMAVNYREAYGIFAVNGILFNHESPRRGETFVTKKIVKAAANISAGKQSELHLGNLDAIRDWGYAPEYVEAMWMMLQHNQPEDFVIATGVPATVRDFVEASFKFFNLNYEKHVVFDERYTRPAEVDALIGDASKAHEILGWSHKSDWRDLVRIMCEHERDSLELGK